MPQQVIDFWFSDATRKLWFKSTPEFDRELTARYRDTWERANRGELDHWMQTAQGCLALVIVLDQFPLNMFRGTAQSFVSEARSREVAASAIEQGFDKTLSAEQQSFLYMPFMHSESQRIHEIALELFSEPGPEQSLRSEIRHKAIIDRFGRYPHRNKLLGRSSSPQEIEFLNQPGSSF